MSTERIEGWEVRGEWANRGGDPNVYASVTGGDLFAMGHHGAPVAVPLPVLAALLRARGSLVLPCPPDLAERITRAAEVLGVPPADYVIGAIGARLARTGEEEALPGGDPAVARLLEAEAAAMRAYEVAKKTGRPADEFWVEARHMREAAAMVQQARPAPAAELAARILGVLPKLRHRYESASGLHKEKWRLLSAKLRGAWTPLVWDPDEIDLAAARAAVEEAERLVGEGG